MARSGTNKKPIIIRSIHLSILENILFFNVLLILTNRRVLKSSDLCSTNAWKWQLFFKVALLAQIQNAKSYSYSHLPHSDFDREQDPDLIIQEEPECSSKQKRRMHSKTIEVPVLDEAVLAAVVDHLTVGASDTGTSDLETTDNPTISYYSYDLDKKGRCEFALCLSSCTRGVMFSTELSQDRSS